MSTFLTNDEISSLTGRKIKSKQIEALRKIGIAFFVNATGHPVVLRSAIEGKSNITPKQDKGWKPNILRAA